MTKEDPAVLADLHLHSVYSDGLYTPLQLCHMAQKLGLTHIALCDHDTLDGLGPMAQAVAALQGQSQQASNLQASNLQASKAQASGLQGPISLHFLPSIELSTGDGGNTHVLGYGASPDNKALQGTLQSLKTGREVRFGEMLRKLERLGHPIPSDLLKPSESGTRGRAHLARALIEMGVVNTMGQAFERFLARGRPAYVPFDHLSTREAVALLRKAHAVPVLAHPMRMKLDLPALNALLQSLQKAGLAGVEVFHPSASRQAIRLLEPMARRQGLLVTGGSDFHGDPNTSVRMGHLPSSWTSALPDLKALMAAIAEA